MDVIIAKEQCQEMKSLKRHLSTSFRRHEITSFNVDKLRI